MNSIIFGTFGPPSVYFLFCIWRELHRANRLKEAELNAAGVALPVED